MEKICRNVQSVRLRLRGIGQQDFRRGAPKTSRRGDRSPESGTRPTGPRLQEEEIFHDLVDFFFDEGARRNMLLSR
jgi:hypothetical protein